ncbi:MAG: SDR family NAD(P)-dependent oxidoreductase [Gammaproteobacteria bacterium]
MADVPARVWITGASSGLGAALAAEYAAAGARVLLTARRPDALAAVAAQCHGRAAVYPGDVTVAGQLSAVIDAIDADGGPPDLTILNAGTYRPMGLAELDTAAIVALFELNVFAVTRTLELLVPRLRARGGGHVAVTGSVAGDIGLPYAGPYSASKAALARFAQALRPELAQAGITLSLIEPGFVRTPLTARNDFPMPFLVDADVAARIIRRALARGRFRIRFPRRMSIAMRLFAALPEPLSYALRRRMLRA